jgi:16S rRNA (cytidine1402-2'-O)-methyltransferase
MEQKMGTLFVVATPIGNLKDITYRAIEILTNVDYILSENPNTTRKILNHYSIQKSIKPYREDNHDRIADSILFDLIEGKSVALVSEAGTPVVSDPGLKLLRSCYEKNIPVSPIPGPSAVTAAVSVFPMPSPKFLFWGFMPRKESELTKIILDNASFFVREKASFVFFESPLRIRKSLTILDKIYYLLREQNLSLKVGLAGEITKIHESFMWNTPGGILNTENPDFKLEKGEYTVVVSLSKMQ